MPGAVYAIATMDTKGEELAFVAQCLRAAGVDVKMVDVGTASDPTVQPDITRAAVTANHPIDTGADRGSAVTAMSQALTDFLRAQSEAGRVAGVIGIGGSGGTAIVTTAKSHSTSGG